ncbi:MAG: hypothetical protein HOM55_10485 [Proteobacteria bacterium]|jgi:hypothetical protein|nr:hypothetical protein [Pseudomonadota bacterium]
MIRAVKIYLLMGLCLLVVACSTVNVEENRIETTVLESSESIVVLGRRHASSYNTEIDLVSCVASHVGRNGTRVIGEAELSDRLYPWLEPRIAPIKIEAMLFMMNRPKVRESLDAMNLRYVVWVDGSTETTDKSGSVSCAIAPGFAGCYGMGVWTNESGYDVSIWDIETMREISQIIVNAEGTSYLPAIVVPIPIIARVQSSACNGIASQVSTYFRGETGETPN